MSEAPSAEALQQAMAGLTHKDGPKDGVGAAAFAAAKEDIAAKAVLKDIRSSTAALASVTPMEALNKVETRGEGISAAVLQAAKEDRDMKRNVPIEASQGIGSLKKTDGAADGLGAATLAAAKEDLIAKALLKDIRSSTAALASVTPMEALSKVETRGEGISAAVLQAAKEDRDMKRNVPIEASQGLASLKKVEGGAVDGLGSNTLAAAKEDLLAKALLKEVRSGTAALASVTPHEALSHVETRGEGVSAAVLEAAKADRELKRSLPRTAAVMATSDSHLTHVEAPKDGISPALMEAAKQDLIEKKGYAEMRKSAVGDAIAVGIAGLKKTEAPNDGVSAAVLEAAKQDRELKSAIPKEAAAAIGSLKLKHVETSGEGVSAAVFAAAKEDFQETAEVAAAKKAVQSGLAGALQGLKHVDAPKEGLSQVMIDAAKAESEKNKQQSEAAKQAHKGLLADVKASAKDEESQAASKPEMTCD